MNIKIVGSGDELLLPLPEEFIARYQLKEGDELNGEALVAELEKGGYFPPAEEPDAHA